LDRRHCGGRGRVFFQRGPPDIAAYHDARPDRQPAGAASTRNRRRGIGRGTAKGTVMKGKPEIIDALNDILTGELTAVNQYFLHARMCEYWGYKRIGAKIRSESIDEMKHADRLIGRVLYLEGLPNLQRLGKLTIGQTVPEQLKLDLEVERIAIGKLNGYIELARSLGDNGTRELFEKILISEEEHVDWLEAQLNLIAQVGETQYLAQQMFES
jgi:bacterioferritin